MNSKTEEKKNTDGNLKNNVHPPEDPNGPLVRVLLPIEASMVGSIRSGKTDFNEIVSIVEELLRFILQGPGQYSEYTQNLVLWSTRYNPKYQRKPQNFKEDFWDDLTMLPKNFGQVLTRFLYRAPDPEFPFEITEPPKEPQELHYLYVANVTVWADDVVIGFSEFLYQAARDDQMTDESSRKIINNLERIPGFLQRHLLFNFLDITPTIIDPVTNELANKRRGNLIKAFNLVSSVICAVQHNVNKRKLAEEEKRANIIRRAIKSAVWLELTPIREKTDTVLSVESGSIVILRLIPLEDTIIVTNYGLLKSAYHERNHETLRNKIVEHAHNYSVEDSLKIRWVIKDNSKEIKTPGKRTVILLENGEEDPFKSIITPRD